MMTTKDEKAKKSGFSSTLTWSELSNELQQRI